MAVAVKTSPGARSGGMPGSLALISLVGVVYLLACLAILFYLLPSLWWPAWAAAGFGKYQFVGGSVLLLLGLAAGVGLLWLGGLLLGGSPPKGVRAGVFVGFTALLLVLFLTRWAGTTLETWAINGRLTPFVGAVSTGVVGGLLLAGWLRLFTLPWTQRKLVELDEMGWFSATHYKGNQGRVVRRATIIGLLLLAGTGVWSLMTGGTLRRGAADWALNIPFTGSVAVDWLGDAREFVAELPADQQNRVQVKWAPTGSDVKAGQFVSIDEFKKAVRDALEASGADVPESVKSELRDAEKLNTVEYLRKVNETIGGGVDQLLAGTTFHADIRRRLREVDAQTGWTDITRLLTSLDREAVAARKSRELGWVTKVPTAIPVLDRYQLQEANEQTDPSRNVRVGLNRNPNFKLPERKIVTKGDFDREEVRVYAAIAGAPVTGLTRADEAKVLDRLKDTSDGKAFKERLEEEVAEAQDGSTLKAKLVNIQQAVRDAEIPERVTLARASGTAQFASLTLLPSVQFTLPLLLLALSVWFAWRIVNLPVFADFLIATEAEMNKVSWTTQKRLVQDTIVVLVTCVLMAVFLFGTDYFWKTVLSWKQIGVLHIPEDRGEKLKTEDKKW